MHFNKTSFVFDVNTALEEQYIFFVYIILLKLLRIEILYSTQVEKNWMHGKLRNEHTVIHLSGERDG